MSSVAILSPVTRTPYTRVTNFTVKFSLVFHLKVQRISSKNHNIKISKPKTETALRIGANSPRVTIVSSSSAK